MMRSILVLVLVLAVMGGQPLAAQAGSSTDIITGYVTGPEGEPVVGARVSAVALESELRRSTVTNVQGRFTLIFPDGEGRYRLEVSFLGMAPTMQAVVRRADEAVLIANVQLDVSPIPLEGLDVLARRQRRTPDRDPGAQERMLAGQTLSRLPLDATDVERLAALAPGVVSLAGGDSIALAFSVLGQGPVGNQMTLDGLVFGGIEGIAGGSATGVPMEAVRVTRMITNTYDVAQGQFSGGLLATTTRRGSNRVGASFTFTLRDPALQWADTESPFSGSAHQSRFSGGGGGALIRNKLFFFGAGSLQRRSEGVASLLSADSTSQMRLGVSPDSVKRMLGIAADFGIFDPTAPWKDDRVSDVGTFLGRLDYHPHPRHTVMLRGDWRWSGQDAFRSSPFGLPQEGGTRESSAQGLLAALTSHFGSGWINELRAYVSRDSRTVDPSQSIPAGRIHVTSELEDGIQSVSTLSFGGGSMAMESRSTNVELANDLSLLLGLNHRVRVGGVLTTVRSMRASGANPYGTYAFPSLEAFADNTPSSFGRMLEQQERSAGGLNGAVYLGDTWRPSEALQLTFGVRAEASTVYDKPQPNQQVERLFGRRTDEVPGDLTITPRLGFSYVLGGSDGGPAAGVLRGGVGGFRATPAWPVFSAVAGLSGQPGTQVQIMCVGEAVPIPDWTGYLSNPGSIPGACRDGVRGRPDSGRGTSVALFDDGFRAPQSWRASLGFQRQLFPTLGFSIDGAVALGIGLQGLRDLNLNPGPRFSLATEGNRPVFVPADAIAPATGELNFFASRRHPELADVLEVHSDGQSRSAQVTLELNGMLPQWRMTFAGSYSYSRSRDLGSAGGWGFGRYGRGGGGGLGTLGETGNNPNEMPWATSDFERRHLLTLSLGTMFTPWAGLTVLGRTTSGAPFTPLVASDINGDGARNDLAFIFDPATTADPALAQGMSRLLETASRRVRGCLQDQLGRIAERNSCVGPWNYALDLRLNLRPELPRLGRRLSVSVDAMNTLNGLDRLLHGAEGLRGWGEWSWSDPVLLYPRGFDPGRQAYLYEVNEAFGDSRSNRLAFRNPFQLQIQAQITVGADRQGGPGGGMRGGAREARRGMDGGPAARSGERMDPTLFLERLFANPVLGIMALRDQLGLNSEQMEKLTVVSDSLQHKLDSISAAVREEMKGAEEGEAMLEIMRNLQPRLQTSREEMQRALTEVRGILTPEQWGQVPAELKNPSRGGAAQRRRP